MQKIGGQMRYKRYKLRWLVTCVSFLSGMVIGLTLPYFCTYQNGLQKWPSLPLIRMDEIEIAEQYPQLVGDQDVPSGENETLLNDTTLLRGQGVGPNGTYEIKLACLVPTRKEQHSTRANAVKSTWGRRCNYLIFMSDTQNQTFQSVNLNVKNGRDFLWGKTKAMFKYAHKHLLDKADWFIKADDDVYIIMENLYSFLSAYDHRKPVYIGCLLKTHKRDAEFMSGGAAYLVSWEALRIFAEHSDRLCESGDKGDEDVYFGKCMAKLNVTFVDGLDSVGKRSFLPMRPGQHLMPGALTLNHWFYNMSISPVQNNMNCCSDRPVSFHWITPEWMHAIEYLLYNVRKN